MTKVYDNATDLITFARSSSGTALRRVGYGPELFVSAATSDPSVVDNGDGSYTFSVTGGANASIVVADALTVGNVYRVAFTLSDWTSGNLAVSLQAFANGGRFNANGTYESFIVASSGDDIRLDRSGSTVTGTVSNISVKEVIFDRATDPLVLFNHFDDTPRIEYGSYGSLKGLLIEEQRTNLVTTSTDISGGNWYSSGNGGVITENAVPAPDGTQTGSTYDTDGAYRILRNVVSVSTGSTYTWSFYAKNIDATDATYRVYDTTQAADIVAPTSYFSQINTSDWTRISVTFTVPAGCSQVGVYLTSSNNGGTVAFWGAQLEEGSFPTSYIPTSGSQQTRSADVASIPVSAFGYNQQAGTVVVEASPTSDAVSTAVAFALSTDAFGTLNRRQIRSESTDTVRVFTAIPGNSPYGTGGSVLDVTGVTIPGTYRAAHTLEDGYSQVAVNGSLSTADTSVSVPEVDEVRIGTLSSSGSEILNGHIKSIQYYPRRLTNAQLQELTA